MNRRWTKLGCLIAALVLLLLVGGTFARLLHSLTLGGATILEAMGDLPFPEELPPMESDVEIAPSPTFAYDVSSFDPQGLPSAVNGALYDTFDQTYAQENGGAGGDGS